MIEVNVEEPASQHAIPLRLRSTKGGNTDAPERMADRVVLGEPAVRLLTPDTAKNDEDLRGFLIAEAAIANYWLLQFTCTFDHDDKLPFTKAWLELRLVSDGESTIAHSMEPAKLTGNHVVSWTAKITFPCVFVQPEVGGGVTVTKEDVSCEARYEGTPKPTWWYYKTPGSALRGLHRMRVVARAPAAAGLAASIRMGASVAHSRFGLKPLSYDTPPDAGRDWLRVPAPAVKDL